MLVLPINRILSQKNPVWENKTPNERIKQDPYYLKLIQRWTRRNGIPFVARFFEVRLSKQQSILDIHTSAMWWNDPLFMDKIFWVFQKPITTKLKEQIYALEYYECQRVVAAAVNKFGRNPFSQEEPSLCLPVDCVELAWEETQQGYSEHIRERVPVSLTQEQLDKEMRTQQEVDRILETIEDVSNDPKWQGNDDSGNPNRLING